MVSLLTSNMSPYHQSMLSKLQGIGATGQASDAVQQYIQTLNPPTAPAKRKLDSIKTPDAKAITDALKPKLAPIVAAPTKGIISATSSGSNAVQRTSDNNYRTGGNSSSSGSGLDAFLAKVAKKESGGNYGAVNKDSGALGKYQVMPNNVAGWTKQALGKSMTTQQFLSSPQAQEAVAKTILGGYLNKYGETGASIAWYSGESNAKKYAKTGKVSTASQGKYPSIAAYAAAIAGR